MRFDICPRLKAYTQGAGECLLPELKVFVIGDGSLFVRSLRIFLPDAGIREVSYDEANIRVSVSPTYSGYNEYCFGRVTDRSVELHCRDNAGARNAAAILAQLARKTETGYSLPMGTFEDWPDAQYRAFMVESSGRVWIPMETILRYIREMALCRMNVLQFHFMEDPGCTVPLESVPDFHGGPNGEKFTRQEVDEMIVYAAELGIRVTPFIEILSHAADFALVEGLVCPGDDLENLYDVCLGQEKTYDAIEKVIREVAAIFPDDTIHIGADEYDMSRVTPKTAYWDQCPHCRKLMEEKGYTTLRELFLYGIQRINEIVNRAGKVMMMWNADLHPGHLPETLDRNILVHYYRYCSDLGREDIYHLHINGYADEGFSVVNSYYPQTYMDLPEYMSAEKLASWSYRNDPLVKKANRAKVPGGCLCAWEEFRHYVRTVPAAIALFADRLWNAHGDPVGYEERSYGEALTRVLFDGKLPEGMNIFTCIGDVLPPLDDQKPAHLRMVFADLATLAETAAALRALAGDDVAQSYAQAIEWVMEEKKQQTGYTGPQTERIKFQG